MADIPDDDSELLGKTTDEIAADLAHRDFIMKHGLIRELRKEDRPNEEEIMRQNVERHIANSTPWTRVSSMFSSNDLLRETDLCKTGRMAKDMPVVVGGLAGTAVAIARVVSAYDEFVRSNKLTSFCTPEMAKRRAADYTMLKALTFGLSTGIKATLLAGGCYTFPLMISAMQGKTSFWEYAVGWGSACSLYCINRGRRSMLIAALVGFVPGLLYGSINLLIARKLQVTFEDMYRNQVSALVRSSQDLSGSMLQ
ncbi:unnamed protein product [Calicophoron daubneyi]|uniref:Complex I assembly factor TIMMDC1, mitochondrial n=1 Tax=Calicophoron daubneyi TaxID=300641 RepID=A0AAV2T1K5_CALDB